MIAREPLALPGNHIQASLTTVSRIAINADELNYDLSFFPGCEEPNSRAVSPYQCGPPVLRFGCALIGVSMVYNHRAEEEPCSKVLPDQDVGKAEQANSG